MPTPRSRRSSGSAPSWTQPGQRPHPTLFCAGLAAACGIGPRVLPYGPAGARNTLQAAVRHLHPGLRDLIACTQAAVDSALLSHRV